MSRLLLVVIAGALFCVGWAAAEDSPITVEGYNYLRYDDGDEVGTGPALRYDYPENTVRRPFFEDRLHLDIYRGNLRLGGRFLYFRPSSEDRLRDGLVDENRIDKRYLEATFDPFKMRVGHFSDVWGHGLAFSSYENRDIFFDTELDGAHVRLESEPFFLTVLRGNSEDNRVAQRAEISAARAAFRGLGQALGFNYVFIDSGGYPETHVASVDWRLSYGIASLYGERAWNEVQLPLRPLQGHATHVGAVLSKWSWSLLVEYKDYAYTQTTPFQNPATVYRELGPRLLQAREPHVLYAPNEVGYQTELSGQLASTSYVTVHYSLASLRPSDPGLIPMPRQRDIYKLSREASPYWETFVSLEQDLPASRRFILELGANEESKTLWQKRRWAWLRFWTPGPAGTELELESETMLVTDRTSDEKNYTDQLIALGLTSGGSFGITVGSEFSTDEALKRREGENWPFVETAFNFGGGRNRLSLFYGRERGGLRCSNGVCRQVQPFTGLRVTMETSL